LLSLTFYLAASARSGIVANLEPGLDLATVAGIIEAVAGARAKRRRLAQAQPVDQHLQRVTGRVAVSGVGRRCDLRRLAADKIEVRSGR